MRDFRVELFRCACAQGGYADAHRGLDNLMTPSVVGFVFISGYYGIKCRFKGGLKLFGIGLASWIVLAVINLDFTTSFGVGGFWWFLWMYLTLMTMALAEIRFLGDALVWLGVNSIVLMAIHGHCGMFAGSWARFGLTGAVVKVVEYSLFAALAYLLVKPLRFIVRWGVSK